jgi:glycine betaine/proline transport system ATP-binding protein
LQAEHVYKVFGGRPEQTVERLRKGADREELRADGVTAAVIDASFAVEPGEIFVVMGLSGSGKSTLLRMLNGLLEPTAGTISFDGQDLASLSPAELRALRSRRISMVFQHFALFPHRTVLQNAAYGLEVQGVPRAEREQRATEALALCGLEGWEKSWPDELSGGMRQRVGLARALATDADLLLMDESFSALDPLIRREMQDQLLELQKTLKKTIVFITHDLNEAMRLGDRIAVMRDGEIVQIGTAEDILVRPEGEYVASFTRDVDRSKVLTAAAVMDPSAGHEAPGCGCPTATPDTPFDELCALCAGLRHPVSVVDDEGAVVGTVSQEQLVAAIGDTAETAEAAHPAGASAAACDAGEEPAAAEHAATEHAARERHATGPEGVAA